MTSAGETWAFLYTDRFPVGMVTEHQILQQQGQHATTRMNTVEERKQLLGHSRSTGDGSWEGIAPFWVLQAV